MLVRLRKLTIILASDFEKKMQLKLPASSTVNTKFSTEM